MFNVLIINNVIFPLLLYPSPFFYITKPNPIPSIFPLAKNSSLPMNLPFPSLV